ncbi:TPA: single-stranded DNA-binding protein [Neisseria meningitidis]
MSVQLSVRGNLGAEFNLRPVASPKNDEASIVLNFSVASPNFKRNAEGKSEVVSTEWISCEYWNRDAAHLHKILQVGMPVFVTGEERYETYTNRDGIEVRVRNVFIVPTERVEAIKLRPKREQSQDNNHVEDADDDIPM